MLQRSQWLAVLRHLAYNPGLQKVDIADAVGLPLTSADVILRTLVRTERAVAHDAYYFLTLQGRDYATLLYQPAHLLLEAQRQLPMTTSWSLINTAKVLDGPRGKVGHDEYDEALKMLVVLGFIRQWTSGFYSMEDPRYFRAITILTTDPKAINLHQCLRQAGISGKPETMRAWLTGYNQYLGGPPIDIVLIREHEEVAYGIRAEANASKTLKD